MKIPLLAALLLFTFGESHAQNRYIIKENNEGKLTYALVNTKGVELKTFVHFSEVETTDGITLAVDNKVGKTGYLDNNGEWIIPPAYSPIWFSNFKNGYAVVYAMDKKVQRSAVINLKNEVIIPFEERILSEYSDGWFAYTADKGHENGYINLKNEKMKGIEFEKCNSFCEGKAAITDKKGKSYYINTKGKPLFKQIFKKVRSFNEGYAIVQELNSEDDVFVLINSKGKQIATINERDIDNIKPFANGWVKIFDTTSDDYFFSNTLKNPAKRYEGKGEGDILFSEGLAATTKGYIDENGEIIVPIKHKYWREDQPFANGVAVILVYDTESMENGVYHLINKQGETVWKSKNVEL